MGNCDEERVPAKASCQSERRFGLQLFWLSPILFWLSPILFGTPFAPAPGRGAFALALLVAPAHAVQP